MAEQTRFSWATCFLFEPHNMLVVRCSRFFGTQATPEGVLWLSEPCGFCNRVTLIYIEQPCRRNSKVIPEYDPYGEVIIDRKQRKMIGCHVENDDTSVMELYYEANQWAMSAFEKNDVITILGI